MIKKARFSEDKKHRFSLERFWGHDFFPPYSGLLMFIGFNPSVADDYDDDNTISKCCSIASYNGYGGIVMCNLYSFIATNPKKLIVDNESVRINIMAIQEQLAKCEKVVFAWGNLPCLVKNETQVDIIKKMVQIPYCLAMNKNGSPKHPLYCKNSSPLIEYKK